MNSKHSGLFIVFFCILFITSCKTDKKVVGFMLPNMNVKRYFVEKEYFTKKITELGGEVIFMNADNDEDIQKKQFEELMAKGIDILVLDPVNRFNVANMVRHARQQGIKVISYDRLISNCEVDAYVTFDAQLIGKQMAEYCLKLKPEGNYMLLGGDFSDINATGILAGQKLVLDPAIKAGKIKISYSVFLEKWSADEANFEVQKHIRLSNTVPDVILAASDGISKGVVKALNELNLQGKVILTGNGGEAVACNAIAKGYQTMTVYKQADKLAVLAADLAIKMLKNENVDDILKSKMFNGEMDVPSSLLQTIPVDASNLRSTVIADGMVTEEELR